jgi:hypothetical protein
MSVPAIALLVSIVFTIACFLLVVYCIREIAKAISFKRRLAWTEVFTLFLAAIGLALAILVLWANAAGFIR